MPKRQQATTVEAPAEPQSAPPETPRIKRHNQLVSEWEEIITPEQRDDHDDDDPFDAILAEIDLERRPTLTVERLPNYERDGRTDSRAVRRYCGRIEFDPEEYRDRIQAIWGAGHYRCSLRDHQGRLRKVWDVHVEHAPPPPGAAPPPMPMVVQSSPQQPDLAALADVARQLAAIRRAMGWDQQPAPPAPPPPEPVADKEDRRIELILNLLSRNETLGERVLQRILGEDESPREEGFLATLARTLPEILALIRQTAQQQAAPSPHAIQPPALADDETADEEEPYMTLIEQLVRALAHDVARGIVDRATVERGARWIEEFERDYPQWLHLIRSLVNGTPDATLAALEMIYPDARGISTSPIARAWVAALQERLKKTGAGSGPAPAVDGGSAG